MREFYHCVLKIDLPILNCWGPGLRRRMITFNLAYKTVF